MFVLYLDAYHLGDPLFLTGLARDVRARHDEGGAGFVIVHGAGEAGERAVEALGIEPVRASGALVASSPEAEAAVERAARDLHRQVVHELTEAGVHAVRVAGTDRGLVRPDGSLGKTGWLATLCRQRAVPVLLSVGPDEASGAREVDPAALSARLALEIGAEAVVALGRAPEALGPLSMAAAAAAVPDGDALRRMQLGGVEVRVARRTALRSPGVPGGAVEPGATNESP
jgi:acetylglutamate kinase